MNVEMLKYPTDEDWAFAKTCTLITIGKKAVTPPSFEWRHKLLEARHSPIRELKFAFRLTGVPYWVSVHLVRHKHAQPYVKTQRNDRQTEYDRAKAPQDSPVDMIWTMNAEELMTIANKRLCNQASKETQTVVAEMCKLVLESCPEFEGLLVPACVYNGGICHEMYSCGRNREVKSSDGT